MVELVTRPTLDRKIKGSSPFSETIISTASTNDVAVNESCLKANE
jgi:hypothetical protein